MIPEKDRRKPRDKIIDIHLPSLDFVAEWQSVGDSGATEHVLIKPPIAPKHRRSDDPKPEPPYDLGVS